MSDYLDGPWLVAPDAANPDAIWIGNRDGYIGEIRREDGLEEIDWRTARLWAAAPAMLEALRWAESFASGFEDDDAQEGIGDALAMIRAAIAAATGESGEPGQ